MKDATKKAVLMSIQPKWCELIASGKKTIEIRRHMPNLDAPFKVYIYCTLAGSNEFFKDVLHGDVAAWNRGTWGDRKGNVIGEFTCSKVSTYDYAEMYEPPDWEKSLGDQYYITSGDLDCSCLSYDELTEYGQGKKLYGLHIVDLKIYDKPKPLRNFHKPCPYRLPDGSRSTEIDCYNKNVSITFSDGTVITIGYGKEKLAVWWIKIEQAGTTDPDLIICDDEDAAIYSDILAIDAELASWELIPLGG